MSQLERMERKRMGEPVDEVEVTNPVADPWNHADKLGVKRRVWEPVWSRRHIEEVLGAAPAERATEPPPPPLKTGEHVPADCVGMFIEGYYREKWGMEDTS